jgi:hypothetical protein
MRKFLIIIFFFMEISVAENIEKISHNSYENRRKDYQHFSTDGFKFGVQDARTIFKYPDGSLGYIQHTLVSGQWNTRNISDAMPGSVILLKQVNGAWQDNSAIIDKASSVPGCIHPRKVVAADYNRDGIIDFVFACHGWDAYPYPGERSRILLSQSNGVYRLDYTSDDIEFKHGATSGDINGDEYPDLIVTEKNGISIFINNGAGYFKKSTDYKIPQVRRAFHIELVDINDDGKPDLLVGGHEWEDSTKIIVNPGNNNFGGSIFNRPKEILIPPITGAGTIVDFLYVKKINSVYILRTGDGKANNTFYYQGMWLQKFDLNSKVSTTAYSNPMWINDGRKWHTWIVEKNGMVVSDHGDSISVPIQ